MLLLCLIWGLQQVAIKVTVPDMAPAMQLATRFGLSAAMFCVLIVARDGWKTFRDGTLASGAIAVGEEIISLPSGKTSRVQRIVTQDGDLDRAIAGQSVTITLVDEIDASRGDVLVGAKNRRIR